MTLSEGEVVNSGGDGSRGRMEECSLCVRIELVSTAGLQEAGAVRPGPLVRKWRENGDELPGLGPV